ncbi:hypothetical protein P9D34_09125 [Bacillus swezeyi]|nr:hypothetical protein [Bacillus swezeyi]MEC1260605.1 hypothetical protein [Bacillus swezeyi]MED2928444.1 hypothetical protein [Bacillus swezeyi]MED2942529.1 hypothetical protein [Bacillus swezeyi]MED2964071.1 hypothetical protein [Bacillus swezeyi]MED2978959.1 hypothetical protein [Bacillus swezeyi]
MTRNHCSLGRASIGLLQDVITTVFGQDVRALRCDDGGVQSGRLSD